MFAIEPLKWCKHLVEVKPLPASGEIDAFQKCEVCSTPQEVWVCLICYKVRLWGAEKDGGKGGGKGVEGRGEGGENGG